MTLKDETCEWFNPDTQKPEVKPAIEVKVVRGAYSQESNINYKWEIKQW